MPEIDDSNHMPPADGYPQELPAKSKQTAGKYRGYEVVAVPGTASSKAGAPTEMPEGAPGSAGLASPPGLEVKTTPLASRTVLRLDEAVARGVVPAPTSSERSLLQIIDLLLDGIPLAEIEKWKAVEPPLRPAEMRTLHRLPPDEQTAYLAQRAATATGR